MIRLITPVSTVLHHVGIDLRPSSCLHGRASTEPIAYPRHAPSSGVAKLWPHMLRRQSISQSRHAFRNSTNLHTPDSAFFAPRRFTNKTDSQAVAAALLSIPAGHRANPAQQSPAPFSHRHHTLFVALSDAPYEPTFASRSFTFNPSIPTRAIPSNYKISISLGPRNPCCVAPVRLQSIRSTASKRRYPATTF